MLLLCVHNSPPAALVAILAMHYVLPVGKQHASVVAKPSFPNTSIPQAVDSLFNEVPMATSNLDLSPISNSLNHDSFIPFVYIAFVIYIIPLSYPLFLCHFLYSFILPLTHIISFIPLLHYHYSFPYNSLSNPMP